MKVSWDYYSQYMKKKNMFQTTNQKSVDGFTTNKAAIMHVGIQKKCMEEFRRCFEPMKAFEKNGWTIIESWEWMKWPSTTI